MTTPTNPPAQRTGGGLPGRASVAGLARDLDALRRVDSSPAWSSASRSSELVTRLAQPPPRRDDGRAAAVAPSWLDAEPGPTDPGVAEDMLDPARAVGRRDLPALPRRPAARLLAVAPRRRRGTALAAPGVAGRLRRRRPRSPRRRTGTTGNAPASSPGSSPARTCARSRPTSPGRIRHRPARTAPVLDALPVIAAWWSTERDEPAPAPSPRADRRRQPGPPQRRPAMTTDRTARSGRATWTAGLAVALGAGVATAHGLYQVAAAAGVPHRWPGSTR